ncbi:hypothetical protein LG3211_1870 [Lysobacter gummosus]|nr:hypothetical protein LG3211_1870 [Lysobacter gummosus]
MSLSCGSAGEDYGIRRLPLCGALDRAAPGSQWILRSDRPNRRGRVARWIC